MSSETAPNQDRLPDERVQEIYRQHGTALRRFLVALLRDGGAADDAFQNAMSKLIEKGHTAKHGSLKAWLFQVAYNEAMMIRRRQKNQNGLLQRAAWTVHERNQGDSTSGAERLLQNERIEEVRLAIERLPAAQQQILKLRVYDNIKFKDIASQLEIPLGTVLSRMHAATRQLRRLLEDGAG